MRYFNNYVVKLILRSYCLEIVICSEEPVLFSNFGMHRDVLFFTHNDSKILAKFS